MPPQSEDKALAVNMCPADSLRAQGIALKHQSKLCLHECFDTIASSNMEHETALVDVDETLTFGQTQNRSALLAKRLIRATTADQDPVSSQAPIAFCLHGVDR